MNNKNILTIILNDDYDTLEMRIEKDSLINLPYFKALLDSNFEENISGKISINVPDISAARNIIRGINKCKYLVDSYMCLDYFGINPNIQKINNLAIDPDNFYSLIKISDHYNNPDDLIDLIINNIPKDYNLVNIPRNILKKIYLKSFDYAIVTNNDKQIIVSDLDNKWIKNMNVNDSHFQNISDFCISDNNEIILPYGTAIVKYNLGENRMLHICGKFEYSFSYRNTQRIRKINQKKNYIAYVLYDISKIYVIVKNLVEEKEIILLQGNNEYNICFSNDAKYIAVDLDDKLGTINIYNVDNSTVHKIFQRNHHIWHVSNIYYSINNTYLISYTKNVIEIFNVETGESNNIVVNNNICDLTFTPDEKIIIISDGEYIKFINIESMDIINTIKSINKILRINRSPDFKYFITSGSNLINVYDMKSCKIIKQYYNQTNICYCIQMENRLAKQIKPLINS
ncbi:hypothetical protein [Saudi moumouvirus]|nr:hypothetical protein [Saudi moumouvirus]